MKVIIVVCGIGEIGLEPEKEQMLESGESLRFSANVS